MRRKTSSARTAVVRMSSRAGLPSPPSLRRRARGHSCGVSEGRTVTAIFVAALLVFFGALFSYHLQVAGFAAKQAAIEAGGDAPPAGLRQTSKAGCANKPGCTKSGHWHPLPPSLAW